MRQFWRWAATSSSSRAWLTVSILQQNDSTSEYYRSRNNRLWQGDHNYKLKKLSDNKIAQATYFLSVVLHPDTSSKVIVIWFVYSKHRLLSPKNPALRRNGNPLKSLGHSFTQCHGNTSKTCLMAESTTLQVLIALFVGVDETTVDTSYWPRAFKWGYCDSALIANDLVQLVRALKCIMTTTI